MLTKKATYIRRIIIVGKKEKGEIGIVLSQVQEMFQTAKIKLDQTLKT